MANHTCNICIEDLYETGSQAGCLPCGHVFHVKCVQPWIKKNRTCPTCRKGTSVKRLLSCCIRKLYFSEEDYPGTSTEPVDNNEIDVDPGENPENEHNLESAKKVRDDKTLRQHECDLMKQLEQTQNEIDLLQLIQTQLTQELSNKEVELQLSKKKQEELAESASGIGKKLLLSERSKNEIEAKTTKLESKLVDIEDVLKKSQSIAQDSLEMLAQALSARELEHISFEEKESKLMDLRADDERKLQASEDSKNATAELLKKCEMELTASKTFTEFLVKEHYKETAEISKKYNKLKGKLTFLDTKIKSYKKRINEMTEKLRKTKNDMETSQAKHREVSHKLTKCEAARTELKERLAKNKCTDKNSLSLMFAKEEVTREQQECPLQRENSAQIQILLKHAQEKIKILESTYQQNLQEKEAELATIQRDNGDLIEQLHSCKEELKQSQMNEHHLSLQFEKRFETVEALHSKEHRLLQMNQTLSEENEKLKDQLKNRTEFDALQKRQMELIQENENHVDEIEWYKAAMKHFRHVNDKQSEAIRNRQLEHFYRTLAYAPVAQKRSFEATWNHCMTQKKRWCPGTRNNLP
ncbi:ring finger domain-containing protein [Ditylenchus destructor]|nr:ring finger domain-containing protein [Ditylenchus destructor]